MRLRRAALATAAACLFPALAACGGSGTQSQAGDAVPARKDKQFVHAKASSVATPIGTLEIHTGRPIDTVPGSDTRELTEQKAPDGLTYLPITWRIDQRPAKPYAQFVETSALPVLDLHSGDASYRLPTPDPAEGADSFYVLIAKSDAHPSLTVGFDGVDQTVDLRTGKRRAGRAAGLYRLSRKPLRPSKCAGAVHWSELARVEQTCKVTGPLLLPYAGGKWAKPGHPWLAVAVTTSLTQYVQAGTAPLTGGVYAPAGVTTTYRLGRRKPVEVIRANNESAVCPYGPTGACNSSAALVFDAHGPSRRLTVTQQYQLTLVKGFNGFDGKKKETAKETATVLLHRPR